MEKWSRVASTQCRSLFFCIKFFFYLPVYFRLRDINPGYFLSTSCDICMWIAWGGSCWIEAACLSISFTHDAMTVMLSCGPAGHKRNTSLLFCYYFHCCFSLKSEDFYICMLLLYLQSASAHADQVCMPNGTTVKGGMGCSGMLFSCSETDSLPLMRGGILKSRSPW